MVYPQAWNRIEKAWQVVIGWIYLVSLKDWSPIVQLNEENKIVHKDWESSWDVVRPQVVSQRALDVPYLQASWCKSGSMGILVCQVGQVGRMSACMIRGCFISIEKDMVAWNAATSWQQKESLGGPTALAAAISASRFWLANQGWNWGDVKADPNFDTRRLAIWFSRYVEARWNKNNKMQDDQFPLIGLFQS